MHHSLWNFCDSSALGECHQPTHRRKEKNTQLQTHRKSFRVCAHVTTRLRFPPPTRHYFFYSPPYAAPTLTTHTHHHASPRKKLSRSQGRRPQQQPSSLPGPAKPNTHNSSLSLKIYAIIDCPQKIFVCCLPLASSPTSHSSRPPQLGRFEIAHSSMGGFSPRRPSVVASLYGES